jgi:formamidopyrimidine-DNA glycosylase
MLEIPEAIVISKQLNNSIAGKTIKQAIAASSPHKFAWYFGDPTDYPAFLQDRKPKLAHPYGGRIEIEMGDALLHIGEGAILRYYEPGEKLPEKHQLQLIFDDDSALIGTVAMYGGFWAFPPGAMDDNIYYTAAKKAVPPLSDAFDYDYFQTLWDEKAVKKSAKAFLATEQRIPGLGNGVLQDILLNAKIHPKRKMNTLSEEEKQALFDNLKSTLTEMVNGGGRDTERDLYGNFGGYKTKLSKRNTLSLCPNCHGGTVKKESYMGGSIYYCQTCQQP